MRQRLRDLHTEIKPHWRKVLLFGIGGILVLIVIGQFLYPSDRLVPFTSVDNVAVSGWQKKDAISKLDKMYADKVVPIYFGQAKKAYRSPKPSEIGLVSSNKTRIDDLNYPWYLRIIPTSILWAHFTIKTDTNPTYQRNDAVLTSYIDKELGSACNVKPENAGLKVSGVKFEVIPSQKGGTCDVINVHHVLTGVKPQLIGNNKVTLPIKEKVPNISDAMASQFGDYLSNKISGGVVVIANGLPQTIPATQLFSWVDISVVDDQFTYTFNADRASAYLEPTFAAKVAAESGITVVSTYNFVETGRVLGANGKTLDINATLDNLKSFIDGDSEQAIVATMPTAPRITYSRSYSPTDAGLSALIQQYAQSHSGIYGVTMVELSGLNRRATYNDTKSFTTASVYKLFVAYSTLKRVEAGVWNWDNQITDGKNLSVCFDDMIVKSDNNCGAALLAKVGYTNITNEAHAIGCINTSFLGNDGIKTTSADLAVLLAQLQTGQILTQQSNRDRLINDMKLNIYRQGIPAGISGSIVADKVGFLDAYLHDAAIVFSPSGAYVLTIMTNGSSWATIADLASKIEALRVQ